MWVYFESLLGDQSSQDLLAWAPGRQRGVEVEALRLPRDQIATTTPRHSLSYSTYFNHLVFQFISLIPYLLFFLLL